MINKTCRSLQADAPRFVFGYTCVNDVTSAIINRDPLFAHGAGPSWYWRVRPVVATGLTRDAHGENHFERTGTAG